MRVVITGGCGFIGHHVVEHLLKNTDWEIIVLDKLSYAANGFDRLRDIKAFDSKRVRTFTLDLGKEIAHGVKQEIGRDVDYLVHLAAETHVDNSIKDPFAFVEANVIGTYHILQYAMDLPSLKRMIYFSTDEVFGPCPSGFAPFGEWDRYNSTNPYSATKAGGEELCLAWANTYGVPVLITHTMNAFGERQHPEKFIPKVVSTTLAGAGIKIHSNPEKTEAGSRFYIHCRNIAGAVLFLLTNDKVEKRQKYNIVGEAEVDNLTLAKAIAEILEKPLYYELVDFHSSRPGHDLRYALDGNKMKEMGWEPPKNFMESLRQTVEWMIAPENSKWLNL